MDARIEPAFVNDRVHGVAGHIEHGHVGPEFLDLLRDAMAVHAAAEDDVRQEQVGLRAAADDIDCLTAGGARNDGIPQRLQRDRKMLAHQFVVFHQ